MTTPADSRPAFAPGDGAPGVLRAWTIARAPSMTAEGGLAEGGAAFRGAVFDIGINAAADDEVLVWRMRLSADVRLAAAQLKDGEAQLRVMDLALRQSPDRIRAVVSTQAGGPSFGLAEGALVEGAAALPAPEQDLLRALEAFQQAGQPAAFGLVADLSGELQGVAEAFQAWVDRLVRFIAHYAWVETEVEGELLGRTVVGWQGDVSTVWRHPLTGAQAALHERALNLALGSRDSLVRAFATAARGALVLATLPALLATPAGAVVALAAAWKFVSQVLAQSDKS